MRYKGTGRANPARDWAMLLCATALALVLLLAWNIWAFKTVVSGGTLGEARPPAVAPPAANALDEISGLLSARAAEDAKYIDGTYRFTDPSQ